MDFNRGGQGRPSSTPAPVAQPAQKPAAPAASALSRMAGFKNSKLYRISFVALLLSGTVLFIAMIFFIVFGAPINRETKYVDHEQYQAVFVNVNGTNGGQVYFGKVTSMTPQYIRLTNVFYIQNQQTGEGKDASASYNLVKLGCELHGPQDEMLINREQVFFWENLKADSQVAQKAAEFYKQNPNGQKCNTNTGSTQQSGGTTQNPAAGTGSTTTTPGASTTTPTPTPTPTTGTGTGTTPRN